MACRIFEKSRNSQCIWQKDGKPIRLQDGKYEWSGSQDSGDCSLRIMKANINYDDGEWECQVTASSFDTDDALSSKPARLVVRIPPSSPRIFFGGQFITSERNLSVKSGDTVRVRCESRGGNPPAVLKWYIDDQELAGSEQKNETEVGDTRRWNAISVMELTFIKEHNRKLLKCLALHEAFSRKAREETVNLDIQYPPIVRLERTEKQFDLEADKDQFRIRCIADANPRPDIVWRKAGGESIFRLGEYLTFDPVRQGDEGTYFCLAKNEVGSSDELSVTFDVSYEPRNLQTEPRGIVDLEVGSKFRMDCSADGNPKPEFEWLQKVDDGETRVYSRGNGREFTIANASYEHEGKWVCTATNTIKGRERTIQSDVITVDVSGRPQVLRYKTNDVKQFPRHSDAEVDIVFCSDPRPRDVQWQWGSLELDEGEQHGRFAASQVRSDRRKDCYVAKLSIADVTPADSRVYYVLASNDRGRTKFGVSVEVIDPIAMSTVVGIAAAGLLIFVMLVFFCIYAYRSSKYCFKPDEEPDIADNFKTTFSRGVGGEQSRPERSFRSTDSDPTLSSYRHHGIPQAYPTPIKREPTYPIPPHLQQQQSSGPRKTPQNFDQTLDEEDMVTNHPQSQQGTILYADLQFPKSGLGARRFQDKFSGTRERADV